MRFFKRRSAVEKNAKKKQEVINRMCESYGIPLGTPLAEIKQRLCEIKDPNKKRIALLNFERQIEQMKSK